MEGVGRSWHQLEGYIRGGEYTREGSKKVEC